MSRASRLVQNSQEESKTSNYVEVYPKTRYEYQEEQLEIKRPILKASQVLWRILKDTQKLWRILKASQVL